MSINRIPALVLMVIVFLTACSSDENETTQLTVNVISNKPYLISGGDALIEVTTNDTNSDGITLVVNGIARNVELVQHSVDDGLYSYRGLLTGLNTGNNNLMVRSGDAVAELPLVNYPVTGPVFSGPQQEPYFCLSQLAPQRDGEKRQFPIGNGEYLDDTASDSNCSLTGRVDYVYRSTNADTGFQPLSRTASDEKLVRFQGMFDDRSRTRCSPVLKVRR